LPLYHQIQEDIRAQIADGVLKTGDRLSPEFDLMQEYGTSRHTVREALKHLELDGYLERRRGKGTYVKDRETHVYHEDVHKYIAVLVPDMSIYVFTDILKAVESIVREEGYDILFYNTYDDVQNEYKYIRHLIRKRVAGVIIAPVFTSRLVNHYAALKKHNIPVVFVDRAVSGFTADSVATDNTAGAYMAVDALLKNGCRKVGHIAGPMVAMTARERFDGYKQALADNGVALDMDIVKFTDFSIKRGYEATRALLGCYTEDAPGGNGGHSDRRAIEKPVDALFTANALVTCGALQALSELGLNVPDDIEVAAFDAIEYSFYTLLTPSVMIAQPSRQIGEMAAEILLRRIRDRREPEVCESITLEPRLIVKGMHTVRAEAVENSVMV
jgi:LacI family transcriptional regulator